MEDVSLTTILEFAIALTMSVLMMTVVEVMKHVVVGKIDIQIIDMEELTKMYASALLAEQMTIVETSFVNLPLADVMIPKAEFFNTIAQQKTMNVGTIPIAESVFFVLFPRL